MRMRFIPVLALALAVLVLGCLSCTFVSDKPGEYWKGENIEFDVGYSFFDAGYFIGFHPLYVPAGYSSPVQFSPAASAFVSQLGANNSFSKDYPYDGSTVTVTGTFTSSTTCRGRTSYRGNDLDWTATVVRN